MAWLALALLSAPAAAHPLDEIVQGAYLTVTPGQILLELDLAPGPLVADVVLKALDANGDQSISEEEAQAYAGRVLDQSTLTIDGVEARWRLQAVVAPPYGNIETAGDVIKIFAVASQVDRVGGRTMAYDNRYAPVKSQCIANVFLVRAQGWRYEVTTQSRSDDGRQLMVSYTSAR